MNIRHSNTNNLHIDSCSLSSSVEIGLYFIRLPFSLLLWLHMAPSQEPVRHFTFRESRWSSEMLWTSPPGWSSSSYLLDSSSYQSLPNRSPYHPWLTDVFVIPHINVFRSLVIHVIFSEMNCTLTVTVNPNCTGCLNHKASFDAATVTMHSASVIERSIVSCNSAFQLMMHSATTNT